MLTSDLSSRESVTWCAMEVPASAQVAVSQSVRVSIQGIRHTGARMPAPPAGALTHRFSLLGRLVFNDYECRWRHITSCLVVFADRSCYSCCTRCHGDDGREWWSTFVWQLSRRRAGLLKCVHNADLQHIIIMLSSSSSAYTAASACSDVTDIKLTVDTICGRTAKCMLWLSMHGELVIMAELDESVISVAERGGWGMVKTATNLNGDSSTERSPNTATNVNNNNVIPQRMHACVVTCDHVTKIAVTRWASRLSKVIVWQIDRECSKLYTTPLRGWSKMKHFSEVADLWCELWHDARMMTMMMMVRILGTALVLSVYFTHHVRLLFLL